MAPVIVTVQISAKSKEKREELLEIIRDIIAYAKDEQGVLRYVVAIPMGASSETSIVLIEDYATEEYREAHLASEPVKLLLSRLSPGSDAIASAPEIHVFQPSLSYQRPDPTDFSEAQLVILASFGYYKGRTSNALDGWSKIVENCEANEPPVLAYAVLEDKEADTIRTVEVYADAGFASTTHVKSAAVKYNQEQNGSDRDGRKSVVKATPVAGFLGR